MSKKELIITIIAVVLAIALVATVIVLKRADNAANGTPTTVPHDHNGDGIPDHGDDAHTGTTAPTTGGNGDAADPNDSDVDISVDLEDIPSGGEQGNSTKPTTGTTEPTTGSNDSTKPTTGSNDSTKPTTGGNVSTEPTGGNDSTEPTTGGNSGAVSGNEIDFDDLLNAGKN